MRKLRSLTISYCRLGSRVHTSKVKLRALSPDRADPWQLEHGVGAAACGASASGCAGLASAALARAAAGAGGHGLRGLSPAFARHPHKGPATNRQPGQGP
jgi:hypothetical protein